MNATATSAQEWKAAVYAYAADLNAYIARGDACNWKGMDDHDRAPDTSKLLEHMLTQLHAANAQGTESAIAAFRAQWPPLYEATFPLLEDNSQDFAGLAWLPDGALMVRTGSYYEPGQVFKIHGVQVAEMPEVDMFGLSPNQQVLALVAPGSDVVRLVKSADQTPLAQFNLPDGSEGLPPGFTTQSVEGDSSSDNGYEGLNVNTLVQIIPFDDASGVVVVQNTGVFLVTASGIRRLLPTADDLQEEMEGAEPYPVHLDMAHAAISPDGRWIVCGSQDSCHCVFNAQGELIDCIDPHSEYPHHAAFFADGRHVAFNACHLYNGATMAVAVDALGSIQSDHYEEHPAVTDIDTSARVYASAAVDDALVLGDANGYLWVRNPKGELQWKQHLGSTINAMAASADGKRLAVGSYSGTVHIIDLTNTQAAPEQIGVRARREVRRWLFWKQQNRPLAW
ncbi:WD40 repeat domain-containing protein [Ottowia sp.]|uniref:WD40 repeat domain-containing protein n=1 Tax=Ottowia sp. TaxID=1898956 RepID=UPI003A85EA1B